MFLLDLINLLKFGFWHLQPGTVSHTTTSGTQFLEEVTLLAPQGPGPPAQHRLPTRQALSFSASQDCKLSGRARPIASPGESGLRVLMNPGFVAHVGPTQQGKRPQDFR